MRYLATGLGFGAKKGHKLIGTVMNAYNDYVFPSGTNVTRDSAEIERELPDWKKSDRNQVLDGNILLIGVNDYGKYAKHLYTYSWADEETQRKRNDLLLSRSQSSLGTLISWKIKQFMRNPHFIAYFDAKQ